MSDLRPILAGALAGGLTFLGLELVTGGASAPDTGDSSRAAAALTPIGLTATDNEDDQSTVELAMSVASLRSQVDDLRNQLSRVDVRGGLSPVGAEADEAAYDLAASIAGLDSEDSRELVLQVLEDERQREEEEREQRALERSLDRAASTADRLAEELGLSGADRDTLAEILTDEAQSRTTLFDDLGDVDWGDRDNRDLMRDRMDELRDQTFGEVELRLGTDVAEAWRESGRGRGGFGGGGFGGGGGRRGG